MAAAPPDPTLASNAQVAPGPAPLSCTRPPVDLEELRASRFTTPADLLEKLNPMRVAAHGLGNRTIGSDPATTGPFYVFVTRPDLNVLSAGARAFLGIGEPTAPEGLAKLLTSGGGPGIIKLLTNLVESYSVSDITMDMTPIGEAWDGAKLSTPKATLSSRQDGTIQLGYQEWSGLPVTLMHKIWIDYVEAVTKGTLAPKMNPNYIHLKMLDYACSIYAFQMVPDGETIEFGVRFTGAVPTAVPFSPWGGKVGPSESIKVTIPYAYSFMEPMDPAIFYEFNVAAATSGVSVIKTNLPESQRSVYKIVFTEGVDPGKNDFL